MDISIVIPAFNEEKKIGHDVEVAAVFIDKKALLGEVIVVDDGSTDKTAEEAEKAIVPSAVDRNVIRLDKNRGKGHAVKTGILASRGEVVLFADSGTCVPYANALPGIERIRLGELDIAMASRRLEDTKIHRNRSFKRRLLSSLFRLVARIVVGVPQRFSDTQCGFKVYRGGLARELFAQCKSTGFLFELEILLCALKRGCRIEEFAVEWTCDLDTRLRPASDAAKVLKEMFQVRSIIKKNKDRSDL
ncbi:MAG: glycosyltransferase [Candidatus Aminicenantes bacterium]|nr:MAG: glycosyltransferase [Candidatus Aminicenantes bacterium]